MPTSKEFETSFGRKIPIIENYRVGLPPLGSRPAPTEEISLPSKAPAESDFGISSDIFQFAMLADWFARTEASDRTFDRMLEIGGGTGLVGQLFKSAGITRHVENIEQIDHRDALDVNRVRALLARIRRGHRETVSPSRISIKNLLSGAWRNEKRDAVRDQIWLHDHLAFMQSTFPYPIDKSSHYWKIAPDVPLSLDRHIVGNFMDLPGQYDFLLSSTAMQHFTVPSFLEKAHSLLAPGGILLIWNAYWYWVLIVNRVFGDFPWARQRLTDDDFDRYMREFQPDRLEDARAATATFHLSDKRYTLNDYVNAGKAAGFKPLDKHRLMPFSGIQNNIGAWSLQGDHGAGAQNEALNDIHCFRKDVEYADLATQSVFLLFQRL